MRTVDSNGNGGPVDRRVTSFLARLMTGVQTGLSASPTAVATPAATAGAAATGASLKFEGFDFNKGADPAKSARYAFAAAAQKLGLHADQQGRGRELVQLEHQGRDGKARPQDFVLGRRATASSSPTGRGRSSSTTSAALRRAIRRSRGRSSSHPPRCGARPDPSFVRPAPSARVGQPLAPRPSTADAGRAGSSRGGLPVVDYVRGAASSNPALAWQVE